MKKINKILLCITALSLLPACLSPNFFHKKVTPRLSQFNYTSASVLPFYHFRRVKYAILSRECAGRDKGTYDDFGGSRDKGETHPVQTASREFYEEAILDKTINLSLQQVKNFIDIDRSRNTHYVIANTTDKGAKSVTYITNFNKYKTQFLDNFYEKRSQATDFYNKEKDSIALVKWDVLKNAIKSSTTATNVIINATVINPITNKHENKKIVLRPYLVKRLHSFFCDDSYTAGRNRKIRFYE